MAELIVQCASCSEILVTKHFAQLQTNEVKKSFCISCAEKKYVQHNLSIAKGAQYNYEFGLISQEEYLNQLKEIQQNIHPEHSTSLKHTNKNSVGEGLEVVRCKTCGTGMGIKYKSLMNVQHDKKTYCVPCADKALAKLQK